ncbi:MAG: class IV adenylate cyclase [Lentimicrobiaceae bacterium]|nr:class IV adenylate cyclase [Lentimicrobiaceae bacterium]
MTIQNIEIKARTQNQAFIREKLLSLEAVFKGIDLQTDTYFIVPSGRLKLREGNIENHLIYYEREDQQSPKSSQVKLYKPENPAALKEILTQALGVKVVVNKKREIYFVDNVKFHLDTLHSLGQFVEIEAIDNQGTMNVEELYVQCRFYMELFRITPDALVSESYSDMLLKI